MHLTRPGVRGVALTLALLATACAPPRTSGRDASDWSRPTTIVDARDPARPRVDGEPVASGRMRAVAAAIRAADPGIEALVIAAPGVTQGEIDDAIRPLVEAGFDRPPVVVLPLVGEPPPTQGSLGAGPAAPEPPTTPWRDPPSPRAIWRCPIPRSAQLRSIDAATVVVRVIVEADGRPSGVQLVQDPGADFGLAAAACAMQKSYVPARDAAGRAVRAMTPPIRITTVR